MKNRINARLGEGLDGAANIQVTIEKSIAKHDSYVWKEIARVGLTRNETLALIATLEAGLAEISKE